MDNKINRDTVEKIQNQFELTDTTTYLWTIPSRLPIFIKDFKKDGILRGIWTYLKTALGWIILNVISMAILLIISNWFPKLALGLAILVCLISLYLWILYTIRLKRVQKISNKTYDSHQAIKEKIQSIGNFYFVIVVSYHMSFMISAGAFAFIISSELLPIYSGFIGDIESKASWFYYYIETFLSVITFDSTDTLGLEISNIEPGNFLSRISTLFLKLFITFGLIDFFISLYNHVIKEKQFEGTPLEAFIYLQNFFLYFMPFNMRVNELDDKSLIVSEFRTNEYAYALDPTGFIKRMLKPLLF